MLQPHVIRRFLGLYGSVNPLDAPEGAMEVADNCVIRSRDVIEPRRGYTETQPAQQGAVANAIAFLPGSFFDPPIAPITIARSYTTPPNAVPDTGGQISAFLTGT